MSEYDPLFSVDQGVDGDESLEEARKLFADAGSAFLRSPLGWLAWALVGLTLGTAVTDVVWSTKSSDWKKFVREREFAQTS